MTNTSKKTYWPHMILGFLAIGLTLSYWTVKSASSMPVQESNQYMLKYQAADIHINEILEKKMAFDKTYTIVLVGKETMVMTDNVNSNRPQADAIKLSHGENSFSYEVRTKEGKVVEDVNATFVLTQPHSRREDQVFYAVPYHEGKYLISGVNINKAGRYLLQFRAEVAGTVGYLESSAYLKP